MATTFTVAAQKKPNDTCLSAVGPTSESIALLPLGEARRKYGLAIIVPWGQHNISVRAAKARLAKERRVAGLPVRTKKGARVGPRTVHDTAQSFSDMEALKVLWKNENASVIYQEALRLAVEAETGE